MKLEKVSTDRAPAAIGPYSQAVKAGNLLFCSGQIPIDPVTGEIVYGDIFSQAEQVMKNISALLEASGVGFENVVKSTVYLADMDYFSSMNEVYAKYFRDHKPARSTIAVKTLPRNAMLEIEIIAIV